MQSFSTYLKGKLRSADASQKELATIFLEFLETDDKAVLKRLTKQKDCYESWLFFRELFRRYSGPQETVSEAIYPGAGVEVILPTENFWIGMDPMESIGLEAAYFVKAESVERGAYVYNEPGPDDPRVMRFGEVPPVVWSETLADLKAILGESA